MRQIVNQMKEFIHSLRENNFNRNILITVSLGAIGISIAANYYLHIVKNKKKRVNKSRQLIEMVNRL
jgi:hypothetical protein